MVCGDHPSQKHVQSSPKGSHTVVSLSAEAGQAKSRVAPIKQSHVFDLQFLVLLTLEGFQITQIVAPRSHLRLLLPLAASPRCSPFDLVFIPWTMPCHEKQAMETNSLHPIVAVSSILDTSPHIGPSAGVSEHGSASALYPAAGSTPCESRLVQFYSLPQRRWVDRIELPSSVFGLAVWGDVLGVALESEVHLFRVVYPVSSITELPTASLMPNFEVFAVIPCYPNVRGQPVPFDISRHGLLMCPRRPLKSVNNTITSMRDMSPLVQTTSPVIKPLGSARADNAAAVNEDNADIIPFVRADESSSDHNTPRKIPEFQLESAPQGEADVSAESRLQAFRAQIRETLAQIASNSVAAASGASNAFRSATRETVNNYVSSLGQSLARARSSAMYMAERALTRVLVLVETERNRLLARARGDVATVATDSPTLSTYQTNAGPPTRSLLMDQDVDVVSTGATSDFSPPTSLDLTLDNETWQVKRERANSNADYPKHPELVVRPRPGTTPPRSENGWFASLTSSVSKFLQKTEAQADVGSSTLPSTSASPTPATIVPAREPTVGIASVISSTVSAVASSAKTAAKAVTSSLTSVADQAREPTLLSVPSVGDVVSQAAHVAWALNNQSQLDHAQSYSVRTSQQSLGHHEGLTLLLASPEDRRIACARALGAREGFVAVLSIHSSWNDPARTGPTQLGSCVWQAHVPAHQASNQVDENSEIKSESTLNALFGEPNLLGSIHFIEWLKWGPNTVPSFACVTSSGEKALIFEMREEGRLLSSHSKGQFVMRASLRRGRTPGPVRSLSWARNGKWLMLTSASGTVHAFNLTSDGDQDSVSIVPEQQLRKVLGGSLGIQDAADKHPLPPANTSPASTSGSPKLTPSPTELSPLVPIEEHHKIVNSASADLTAFTTKAQQQRCGKRLDPCVLEERVSKLRLRFSELLNAAKVRLALPQARSDAKSQATLPFALPIVAGFVPAVHEFSSSAANAEYSAGNIEVLKYHTPNCAPFDDIIVLGASPRVMLVYSLHGVKMNNQDTGIVLGNNSKRLSVSPGRSIGAYNIVFSQPYQHSLTDLKLVLQSRWYIPSFGTRFYTTASLETALSFDKSQPNLISRSLLGAYDPTSRSNSRFRTFIEFCELNDLKVSLAPEGTCASDGQSKDADGWSSKPAIPCPWTSKIHTDATSCSPLWNPALLQQTSPADISDSSTKRPLTRIRKVAMMIPKDSTTVASSVIDQHMILRTSATVYARILHAERKATLERLHQQQLASTTNDERFSLVTGVKSPPSEGARQRLAPEFTPLTKPLNLPTPPSLPLPGTTQHPPGFVLDSSETGTRSLGSPASLASPLSSPPPPPRPPSGSGRPVLSTTSPGTNVVGKEHVRKSEELKDKPESLGGAVSHSDRSTE